MPSPQAIEGRAGPRANKTTLALEAARDQLDKADLASRKRGRPLNEPRDILLESANYFWDRAQWLSAHAKKLAHEDAHVSSIQAIMDEAEGQLVLACKCAEQASPYFHAKISGPLPDGDAVVAYVARLPAPCTDMEEWAAEFAPDRKQIGSH
jgi:hypothetical protein